MIKPIHSTLPNGLKIALIPSKEVETITVQLRGKVGSNYEKEGEIGASHFLEHLVLKGTKNYPNTKNFSELITDIGGKFIGITSRDDVLYGVHILKEDLESSLIFLSEILYNALLEEKHVRTLKDVIKQEILRYNDIPEKLIGRLSYKILYPENRLSKLNTGDTVDIEKIQIKTVKDYYQNNYTNNNFLLLLCGNFDLADADRLLNKYFYQETADNTAENPILKFNQRFAVQVGQVPTLNQNYIKVDYEGYKISEDRKYAAAILSKILNIYLRKQLVEDKGMVYQLNCDSYNSGNYGVFGFFTATTDGNFKLVLDALKVSSNEINKLLSTRNVNKVKNMLAANLAFMTEKISQRANYYSELILFGAEEQEYTYEVEKIRNTGLEELTIVLNEIFSQQPKITVLSKRFGKEEVENLWMTKNSQQ
ncbi:insulinase family protein [candidate division WWE3 bacterium]|jgi:predicted Zn-dependent peptidase|uniref:Insulinase family protein n=1 Tax=candidate division WWE3 bacterium TaxID=2053526 RepID=A0A3A4ZFQ9_UNCKA|nr:MAG: insulinase family protein [candidate division WWE3 bacterium]